MAPLVYLCTSEFGYFRTMGLWDTCTTCLYYLPQIFLEAEVCLLNQFHLQLALYERFTMATSALHRLLWDQFQNPRQLSLLILGPRLEFELYFFLGNDWFHSQEKWRSHSAMESLTLLMWDCLLWHCYDMGGNVIWFLLWVCHLWLPLSKFSFYSSMQL